MAERSLDVLVRLRADVDKAIADLKGGKKTVDDIGASAAKSSRPVSALGGAFRELVGAALGFVSIQAFFGAIVNGFRESAREEQAMRGLLSTIRAVGGDTRILGAEVGRLAEDMQQLGFDNDETIQSFKSLLQVTEDFALSQRAIGVASQLAKDQQISLAEATQQLVSVYNGVIPRGGVLRALLGGIAGEMDKGVPSAGNLTAALDVLAKKLPEVNANLDTTNSRLGALQLAWGDFTKALVGPTGLIRFDKLTQELKDAAFGLRVLSGNVDQTTKDMLRLYDVNKRLDTLRNAGTFRTWWMGEKNLQAEVLELEGERVKLVERIKAARAASSPESVAAAAAQQALSVTERNQADNAAAAARDAVSNAGRLANAELQIKQQQYQTQIGLLRIRLDQELALAQGNIAKENAAYDRYFKAVASERAKSIREQFDQITAARNTLVDRLAADSGVPRNQIAQFANQGNAGVRAFQAQSTASPAQTQVYIEQLREIIALQDQLTAALNNARLEEAALAAERTAYTADLERQINSSENYFEGIQLGARRAGNSVQSLGSMGAQTVDMFQTGLASAGGQLFDNLTRGAQDFGQTVRQVFSDLLRQIAQAIVQSLILRAIQTGMSAIGGAGAATGGVVQGNGQIQRFAVGGIVPIGSGPTADDVTIRVSKGEGIVRAAAVQHYGAGLIHKLNSMSLPRFAAGGIAGAGGTAAAAAEARPLINVVAFGDDQIDQLMAQQSARNGTFAALESDRERLRRLLRGAGVSI